VTQVLLALSQTSSALHQKPPALLPGQHAWPLPPQATQAPAWHALNGAVQPTPPPQHASPMPPHEPPPHAPMLQVPWPPPHAPPLETQDLVV
jgi:hypothetical protein